MPSNCRISPPLATSRILSVLSSPPETHASRRGDRATAHTAPMLDQRPDQRCPLPDPRDGRLRHHSRLWPGGRPAAGRQGERRRDARIGGSRGRWRCPRAGRCLSLLVESNLLPSGSAWTDWTTGSPCPTKRACFDIGLDRGRPKRNWSRVSFLAIVPGLDTPPGESFLRRTWLNQQFPVQVLEADIAGSRETGDGDVFEIVIRAVRALSRRGPLVEIEWTTPATPFKTTLDLGALGGDRHVVRLASGLLGVHLGCDQAEERPRIVESAAGRVVEVRLRCRCEWGRRDR